MPLRSAAAAAVIRLRHLHHHRRTFIAARIKWVCDPELDAVVSKEKNLQQVISLKDQIVSSPSKSLPLSAAASLKHPLRLPTTAAKFSLKYPSVFSPFQPSPGLPTRLKLTPRALVVHGEESSVHSSRAHQNDAAKRLAKLLMLAGAKRLPFSVIDRFRFDLGLPHNYVTTLLADYPEYFQVCAVKDVSTGEETLALELVSWRSELAVSELKKRAIDADLGFRKRKRIGFPMSFPRGFDLEKRVRNWVEEWQILPYISPYEDAFHLAPNTDQAEKWTVAVIHELLWILVSKKTEGENLYCLGEYLGFGSRLKKALVHHPGIFYISNKIRTQTVVLREGFRKGFLVEKHPLMGMRHRYIHLMNQSERKRRKPAGGALGFGVKKRVGLG